MAKSPLDDLSFFKFPELTQEVVRDIVILFVVIGLTALATIVIQRFLNRLQRARQRQDALQRFFAGAHITPGQKLVLDKLLRLSSAKNLSGLVSDAAIYEQAVARMVEGGDVEDIEVLGSLRRVFHQNVMNPTLEFVSTRQLLPDLSMRLIARVGEEKLDLYCSLLDIDEQLLYFDLSYDIEIAALLRAAPDVMLVYWRERGGETLFQLQLEHAPSEDGAPLFRARHQFCAEDVVQRADFRLSVNMGVRFNYHERDALRALRGAVGELPQAQLGSGKMVDLSFGGGAFKSDLQLAANGIAQLTFNIQRQAVRLMLEVRSSLALDDGNYIIRGRWRGTMGEGRALLNKTLTREQVKRLREKGAFHFGPEK